MSIAIPKMIPPDPDSPLEHGIRRPGLRRNHPSLIMGQENSFLRTCLLPMGANMEPRFDHLGQDNSHDTVNHENAIEEVSDEEDDYIEENSDEEYGCTVAPGRKYPSSSLDIPPQELAAPLLMCLLAATIASILLLRNEPQMKRGPTISRQDLDLIDQNIATSFDGCGPRAYAYNAGILQWEQVGEDLEHMAITNEDESGQIRYYAVALSWDGRLLDPTDPPNYWQPAFMRDEDYIPSSPTPAPLYRPTVGTDHGPASEPARDRQESPTPAPISYHPAVVPKGPTAVPAGISPKSPTPVHIIHPVEVPTFSSYETIPTSHVYNWDRTDGSTPVNDI